MDFRGSIASSRSHTLAAIGELNAYDRGSAPSAPHNQRVIDAARRHVSPGATRAGSDALDAARWERWVTVRQIRDVGNALALLDRAWWDLGTRYGAPNVDGARRALHEAVSMLDSASYGGRWASAPVTPAWTRPVAVA